VCVCVCVVVIHIATNQKKSQAKKKNTYSLWIWIKNIYIYTTDWTTKLAGHLAGQLAGWAVFWLVVFILYCLVGAVVSARHHRLAVFFFRSHFVQQHYQDRHLTIDAKKKQTNKPTAADGHIYIYICPVNNIDCTIHWFKKKRFFIYRCSNIYPSTAKKTNDFCQAKTASQKPSCIALVVFVFSLVFFIIIIIIIKDWSLKPGWSCQ